MVGQTSVAFDPQDLFKRVKTQATTQDYRNRQSIFSQGDKADAMYYVRSGNVKLTVESKHGKKAVIAILRHGDFFGESCLAKDSLRVSTATAIHTSTISRVKRAAMVRTIHQEPAFAKLFISYLLSRIGRIEEEFVDQIFNSSEKRLARILLMLAGFGLQSNPEPVLLKVSQETLAEMVGTTRSRVSYFMNRFRKLGLISYNGSLQVHRELRTFLLQEQT
ncbi:MAG TPA: Crp/Fnr family transcriptional regulator [Terriglobales bacterium]|nr:Crp/Fnr family transcriptional regulator [Terriglobales bacterium]